MSRIPGNRPSARAVKSHTESHGGRPSEPRREQRAGGLRGRSRAADGAVAAALGRAAPAGNAAGAGYLDSLWRRPALPAESERELVRSAQAGDRAGRARLVEAFLPLIGSVARVYRDSTQVDRVELLQEGVVGLLRALERYDPDQGVPFWGYASFWVRQAMQQLVAELTRPLVLSDRALRQLETRALGKLAAGATLDCQTLNVSRRPPYFWPIAM